MIDFEVCLKTVTLEAPSLSLVLSLIEKLPNAKYATLLYRGQGDATWPLIPFLYRIRLAKHIGLTRLFMSPEKTQEQLYDDFEDVLLRKFFDEGVAYLPPVERNYINDRVVAQHFGVPTRLLDWSRDPFVALFFAIERWNDTKDAALFIASPYRSDVYIDNRKVDDANKMLVIEPPAIDRRIPAQKSVLTHHDYGNPNELFRSIDDRETDAEQYRSISGGPGTMLKVIIPTAMKFELYQQLQKIGFDRRNLFPGLEGVGAYVASFASTYWL